MYKNILVPVALDHDRDVAAALGIARSLAAADAKITALNVIELLPSYATEYLPPDLSVQREQSTATEIKTIVGEGTDVVVVHGHSGRTILDYADDHDVDLIVIASHRPGLQDYFLGSTAARVVRHAQCAVHIVR